MRELEIFSVNSVVSVRINKMEKLPQEFIQRMQQQLGGEAEEFFHALEKPSVTSIRLNHLKGRTSFTSLENVPWCEEGYYLPKRPSFHLDPHWHGGAYYVQEASSMILDAVIKQIITEKEPKIWLDVCAAPGGKTGILAKHMGPQDVIVANEVVPKRRAILRENLYKAGYLNTIITSEQPSAFTEPFADIILIDAPCSGEGMMRKEPEAIHQWSQGLVRECSLMQRRIVDDVIKALKPGGHLIYSTCSYSMAENMDNVKGFVKTLQLTPQKLIFPNEWNITTLYADGIEGYQLYPHKVKGEGLFIAVLKNEAGVEEHKSRPKKQTSAFCLPPDWLKANMRDPGNFMVLKNSEHNSVITLEAEEKANEVLHQFPKGEIIAEGGQLKGKDFIPSHFLAMAHLQSTSDSIDLSLDLSFDYLERNTTILPINQSPGWHIISYQNTNLGWAKFTPQGWKNHYPLNWRLRSRKMS